MGSGATRHYIIPILSKALDILELLEKQSSSATPDALQRWTGISQSTVYRILRTLVHRGYVVRTEGGAYRLVSRPRKLRFGLCSGARETSFTLGVLHSLREASLNAGIDLLISSDLNMGAHYPEQLPGPCVDLMILFQVAPEVGAAVAWRLATAGISMIAVDTPLPRATYCGLDHYSVGIDIGIQLARHAATQWPGQGVKVLGVETEPHAVSFRSVIAGAFEGVRTVFPDLPSRAFIRTGGGTDCVRAMAQSLSSRHQGEKLLIAASTDSDAMHMLTAVRSLRRQKQVAILGFGCTADAIREMSDPSSPWIGSVSPEGDLYGSMLVDLGLSLLRGNRVQPYNFVPHRLITAAGLRDRALSPKAEYSINKSAMV
jgi:ribose transport system substrate-binding protein